jgi:hypothetical protein
MLSGLAILSTKNVWSHSVYPYGIIFWGNSPNIINVFRIQKRIIRVIMNVKTRDSCRDLFKNLKILPMYSQYILDNTVKCRLKAGIWEPALFPRQRTRSSFPPQRITTVGNVAWQWLNYNRYKRCSL